MVVIKIQGGIGNQMFQYAYAKYISIYYNVDVLFDISFYNLDLTPKRFFLLNEFKNININICNKIPENIYIISDDFSFKEIYYSDNNNYYLNGFWQSEKYFEKVKDQLKFDFTPNEEIINKLSILSPLEKNISLHVRRTDYLNTNGVHPILDISYYETSLKLINNYDNLFVFSDDIEWCKNNLNFKNTVFMENLTEIETLYLMSLCNHNIIANSSFSWWGAWLNNNTDKIVIAPKKWFGDFTNLNEKDIIPNKWLKI